MIHSYDRFIFIINKFDILISCLCINAICLIIHDINKSYCIYICINLYNLHLYIWTFITVFAINERKKIFSENFLENFYKYLHVVFACGLNYEDKFSIKIKTLNITNIKRFKCENSNANSSKNVPLKREAGLRILVFELKDCNFLRVTFKSHFQSS